MLSKEFVRNATIDHVLKMEGGYVNDPRDPGGETKYGISKRSYPGMDIANLTKREAREIYRADYWNKVKGDELPAPLAIAVMDYAVNSGVSRAAKTLQQLVRATDDGVIGPQTVAATRDLWEKKGMDSVRWYNKRRLKFVASLDGFKAFGDFWINRILSVTILATRLDERGRGLEL